MYSELKFDQPNDTATGWRTALLLVRAKSNTVGGCRTVCYSLHAQCKCLLNALVFSAAYAKEDGKHRLSTLF